MKLNTAKRSVQTGGMAVNVAFSIDMNSKAFSVLSDDMYSDKVGAIVRELSSNAYDAHVAAGKPQEPFEVGCPSAFDPHFYVKDEGTGLKYFKFDAHATNEIDGESTMFIDGDIRDTIDGINLMVINSVDTEVPSAILYDRSEDRTVIRVAGNYKGSMELEFDDALVLYSTYFRSTKEDSNDYVGAFGLGSKTPFAYTDNFFVTNVYEGQKSVYNILTDENGHPQIRIMGRAETTEPNGLEVKIAVDANDYDKFAESISKQLIGFDPRPNILNATVDIPQVTHRGEHFIEFDTNLGNTGGSRDFNIFVGNNRYSVYSYKLQNGGVFAKQCALRFDIGELMVTSTREELSLDDEAYELIKERHRQAIDEYNDYLIDSLESDSMTCVERAKFANDHSDTLDLVSDQVRDLVDNVDYDYQRGRIGLQLNWGQYSHIEFDEEEEKYTRSYSALYPLRFNSLEKTYGGKLTSKDNGKHLEVKAGDPVTIFVKDTSHAFLKRISHWMHENWGGVDIARNVFVTPPQSTAIGIAEDARVSRTDLLKALVDSYPLAELVYLSEIELPKSTSTYSGTRTVTPIAREYDSSIHSVYRPKNWSPINIPLKEWCDSQDEDTYLICTERNELVDVDNEDMKLIYRAMKGELGLDGDIYGDVNLVAMPRAKFLKAVADYGMNTIDGLLDGIKDDLVVSQTQINAIAYKNRGIDNASMRRKLIALSKKHNIDSLELSKALRFSEAMDKRYGKYSNDCTDIRFVLAAKGIDGFPASDWLLDMIDNDDKVWDNICTRSKILETLNDWMIIDDQYSEGFAEYVELVLNK